MNDNNNHSLVWAGKGLSSTDNAPQTNFAVLVEGNRILETGSYTQLRQSNPRAEIVGGEGYLLMPALVNSHEHGMPIGAAALGASDDLLETWLLQFARKEHVEHVMINGKWVVRDGNATGLDQAALETVLKEQLASLDPEMLEKTRYKIGQLQPYIRSYYASWDNEIASGNQLV